MTLKEALKASDDFDKFETILTEKTRELIQQGIISKADVAAHGGWVRSTTLLNCYFIYPIGSWTINSRIYLNIESGETFKFFSGKKRSLFES